LSIIFFFKLNIKVGGALNATRQKYIKKKKKKKKYKKQKKKKKKINYKI